MSDKEHLWNTLVRKNPRLKEDPHFTPDSVRKFFDVVYDSGYRSGCRTDKTNHQGSTDFFNKIFGL